MTTGPLPRIVAVVVTFNRLGLLETLVERLGEIDGLAEILVIDNASTDGTGEWLAGRGHRRDRAGGRTLTHQPAAAPAASTTAWPGPSSGRPTWSG